MKISIRKLYVISLSALITVACSSQSESEGMLIINNKTSEDITKVNLTGGFKSQVQRNRN